MGQVNRAARARRCLQNASVLFPQPLLSVPSGHCRIGSGLVSYFIFSRTAPTSSNAAPFSPPRRFLRSTARGFFSANLSPRMRYRPVRIVDLPCERAARKGRGSGPGSKRRWWVQRDRSKGAATVKRAVRVDEEGEEERERERCEETRLVALVAGEGAHRGTRRPARFLELELPLRGGGEGGVGRGGDRRRARSAGASAREGLEGDGRRSVGGLGGSGGGSARLKLDEAEFGVRASRALDPTGEGRRGSAVGVKGHGVPRGAGEGEGASRAARGDARDGHRVDRRDDADVRGRASLFVARGSKVRATTLKCFRETPRVIDAGEKALVTPAERHGAASRVPHGRGGARRRAPPPRPRVARARPRVHHRGVRRRLRPPGPPQLAHVRCAPRVVGGHRRPPPLLFHTTTRASR